MGKRVIANRNKNVMRPRKGSADKARRTKVQKARLVKLGVPAEVLDKMNAAEIRTLLKRPAKIKRAVA